jgi:hypothetical protein
VAARSEGCQCWGLFPSSLRSYRRNWARGRFFCCDGVFVLQGVGVWGKMFVLVFLNYSFGDSDPMLLIVADHHRGNRGDVIQIGGLFPALLGRWGRSLKILAKVRKNIFWSTAQNHNFPYLSSLSQSTSKNKGLRFWVAMVTKQQVA